MQSALLQLQEKEYFTHQTLGGSIVLRVNTAILVIKKQEKKETGAKKISKLTYIESKSKE